MWQQGYHDFQNFYNIILKPANEKQFNKEGQDYTVTRQVIF